MEAVKCDLQFSSCETGLKSLFAFAYSTNCLLDDQPLTPSEQQTILDLDDTEVLDNLKDLLVELLNVKRDLKATEQAELRLCNEKLEGMLQKLEAEVRGRIRVEQQLRLHLETALAKVEELTKGQYTAKEGEKERKTTVKLRGIHIGNKTRKSASDAECDQVKSQLLEKEQELERIKQDYRSLLRKHQTFKANCRSLSSSHEDSLAHRTQVLSPYKEKPNPMHIRTVYQTYVTNDLAKARKKGKTGEEWSWKRGNSTRRSRPNSSLQV